MAKDRKNLINYIKNPFAINSIISGILVLFSVIFFAISINISVHLKGQGGLDSASTGFCSIILSIFGIIYGCRGFYEKEKNYLLSKISIALGCFIELLWLIIIFLGFR